MGSMATGTPPRLNITIMIEKVPTHDIVDKAISIVILPIIGNLIGIAVIGPLHILVEQVKSIVGDRHHHILLVPAAVPRHPLPRSG